MRRFHDTARREARLQSEQTLEDYFDHAATALDPEDEDTDSVLELLLNDMKYLGGGQQAPHLEQKNSVKAQTHV